MFNNELAPREPHGEVYYPSREEIAAAAAFVRASFYVPELMMGFATDVREVFRASSPSPDLEEVGRHLVALALVGIDPSERFGGRKVSCAQLAARLGEGWAENVRICVTHDPSARYRLAQSLVATRRFGRTAAGRLRLMEDLLTRYRVGFWIAAYSFDDVCRWRFELTGDSLELERDPIA